MLRILEYNFTSTYLNIVRLVKSSVFSELTWVSVQEILFCWGILNCMSFLQLSLSVSNLGTKITPPLFSFLIVSLESVQRMEVNKGKKIYFVSAEKGVVVYGWGFLGVGFEFWWCFLFSFSI